MATTECIEKLKNLTTRIEDGNITQYIELLSKITAKDKLEIVVAGSLSNGKTTLINCLLNEKMLPASIGSTTSSVTKIQYGNNEIVFNNITLPFNQDNLEKAVKESEGIIEIALGNFPYKNTIIVDTPGVDDIIANREQKTFSYIPESDAVIMVFDASKGIRLPEKKFLEDKVVQSFKDKIFIIFNKADTVSDEIELSRLKDKLIEDSTILNVYKNIYGMSAKNYLSNKVEESNFLEFKNDLDNYLEGIDKNRIRKYRIGNILDKIKQLAENYSNTFIDSLSKDMNILSEGLNRQKNILLSNKDEVRRMHEEFDNRFKAISGNLKEESKKIQNSITNDLSSIQDISKKIEYFNNIVPNKIKELEGMINENIKKNTILPIPSMNNLFFTIISKSDMLIESGLKMLGKHLEKDLSFLIEPIKKGVNFITSQSLMPQLQETLFDLFNNINNEINSLVRELSLDLKKEVEFEKIYLLENDIKSTENAMKDVEKDKESKGRLIEAYNELISEMNKMVSYCRENL